MENSSQMGVLTTMHTLRRHKNIPSPVESYRFKRERGEWVRDLSQQFTSDFVNIAPLRSYVPREWCAFEQSHKDFSTRCLGGEYPNAFPVNGEMQSIYSPSMPGLLVGKVRFARGEDVSKAMNRIDGAYNQGEWCKAPVCYRAGLLLKTASLILAERNNLASLIMYEAGKTALEALGDVDEAIDFLHYYARCALETPEKALSRGSYGVISPWNFPLAIPCGMVAAPFGGREYSDSQIGGTNPSHCSSLG